jgi:hypothetical protein
VEITKDFKLSVTMSVDDKAFDSEYFDDNDDDTGSLDVALGPRQKGRSKLRSSAVAVGALCLSALLGLLLWGAVHASRSPLKPEPPNSRELLPSGKPLFTCMPRERLIFGYSRHKDSHIWQTEDLYRPDGRGRSSMGRLDAKSASASLCYLNIY